MPTTLEILRLYCDEGDQVFDGNNRLNQLYEGTAAGTDDWMKFVDDVRQSDPFPNTTRLGWLQHASSSTFVAGPSVGMESIFTPAIRRNRVSFRLFMGKLLDAMTGAGCVDILPLYEPLACAISETVEMRDNAASISAILGLTRQAGEALDSVMSPLSLQDEVNLSGHDLQKIRKQQMANFYIGLRTSTRVLRKIAAGDKGFDDSYWAKTAASI